MIEIRDVRIEDAEEIAAILNPIIAARLLYGPRYAGHRRPGARVHPQLSRTRVSFSSPSTPHNRRSSAFRTSRRSAISRTPSITSASSAPTSISAAPPGHRHAAVRGDLRRGARGRAIEKFFTYVRADNEAGLQTYLQPGLPHRRHGASATRKSTADTSMKIVIEKMLPARQLAPMNHQRSARRTPTQPAASTWLGCCGPVQLHDAPGTPAAANQIQRPGPTGRIPDRQSVAPRCARLSQQQLIETRSDVESEIQKYPTVILQCIIELR